MCLVKNDVFDFNYPSLNLIPKTHLKIQIPLDDKNFRKEFSFKNFQRTVNQGDVEKNHQKAAKQTRAKKTEKRNKSPKFRLTDNHVESVHKDTQPHKNCQFNNQDKIDQRNKFIQPTTN